MRNLRRWRDVGHRGDNFLLRPHRGRSMLERMQEVKPKNADPRHLSRSERKRLGGAQ